MVGDREQVTGDREEARGKRQEVMNYLISGCEN